MSASKSSSNSQESRPVENNKRHQRRGRSSGLLPRSAARQRGRDAAEKKSDFLLRAIQDEEKGIFTVILSVRWDKTRHFPIEYDAEREDQFFSIKDLLNYYYSCDKPITKISGVVMRRAICRETWELRNEQLEFDSSCKKLGEGNYGDVYLDNFLEKPDKKIRVAVKTFKLKEDSSELRNFLREARMMRSFNHPHVVRMIGLCAQQNPIVIIMEYAPGGTLLQYLTRKAGNIREITKIRFAKHAADGMAYLESKQCIHRDLAARNCLLGESRNLKIADFGLNRQGECYPVSGEVKLPWQWTSPDSISYGIFDSKSDVWSCGVVLWEIYTDGTKPYKDMPFKEAMDFLNKEPGKRATFKAILQSIEQFYQKYKDGSRKSQRMRDRAIRDRSSMLA